eukprot:CAMPEP_0196761950 /NCGR_PEP_ID=MMETSP1095-20130614/1269_1 /TAXON_ID=96789 ORGANISM="Chromulina nebulosa, Strain UTEXLB2642" /NCGR_SAMPLE_ID=MMETSP1095 /ASSEMBLY_ACC=CAM_ASM_000446 /LENGTH=288 /DNA_ID=CAMNT_0042112087 /DNA_START=86 /DNA_END=952 /DNA_ORIENTATION=+
MAQTNNGMIGMWSYPVHESMMKKTTSQQQQRPLPIPNLPNAVPTVFNNGVNMGMMNGLQLPPQNRPPINQQERNGSNEDGSSGEENEDGTEPSGNGEVLHCMFPGCLKEFSSRWSLTRHTRTHTGERPFRCGVCAKEFVQKCSLKRHEQTHSQEKQWLCDFPNCGKRFKLKEYLDVHKRTHVKVEPDPLPAEEDDPVVQDAADAAGALIDQLRQRLVRMSVRHHEQLFAHQQKELQLTQALKECASFLDEALSLLANTSTSEVPAHLLSASMKFSSKSLNGFDVDGPM